MAEPTRAPHAFDGRAVLALLAVQICYATFPVLGKIAMREIPPFVVAAFRVISGAALLTLAARILAPDSPKFDRRDRWTLAGVSVLGIVANQTLFINGLARTTATNTTLITATTPVYTLLLAVLFRVEKASWRPALGVPAALAGVLLLLDLRSVHLGSATLAGDLLIAVNSVCYAAFLVAWRGILSRRPAIAVTAAVFRWGAAPVLLLALPDVLRFRPSAVHAGSWAALAGVILLSTLLAYSLTAWALSRTTPSTAAVFTYVQPLLAISLAFLVLGERPGPRTALAALLIFAGVGLTTISRRGAGPLIPPGTEAARSDSPGRR